MRFHIVNRARAIRDVLLVSLVLAGLNSCNGTVRIGPGEKEGAETYSRSVYYWKTRFELDASDSLFLNRHGVGKIYLRLFDVDLDKDWGQDSIEVVPVGTTKFLSKVPEGVEIVPTVFITVDAIRRGSSEMDHLAELIVTRILAMSSYNGLGEIHEVQYDCDWPFWTEGAFYHLCQRSRELLSERDICLSGTVRLHQLVNWKMPFDKGVLMMYNVGAIKDYNTENSILNVDDVSAYLTGSRLKAFRRARSKDGFQMDVAYPIYGWGVVFRDKKFLCILHTCDFDDESVFERMSECWVRVRENIEIDGNMLLAGDEIRSEIPDMRVLRRTKAIVESAMEGMPHSNLIYHLDEECLSRFTDEEIEEIYS